MWKILSLVTTLWMTSQLCRCTPLDDYVNTADPHYEWTKLEWTHKAPGYTMHLLNMTSQKWMTENEVDRPIWFHYIVVAVPDTLTQPDTGFLYIAGRNNEDSYIPDVADDFNSFVAMMAVSTGAISAVVKQIPNQPLVFKDDPSHDERKEDAIIAWTWREFVMKSPDKPEWLLRLPMTKAAVRAMDAVSEFSASVYPKSKLDKFMVCGESKRGWTTWTTGAVDKRVVAIAPIVMDLLNVQENLHHHFRSLGGWTFAFNDYYQLDFTEQLDNPNTKKMMNIVDPYSYKDRLTMPKYIVTTSGDEFFLPDDPKYYLKDLKGDTYLRRIPNAEHSLKLHRVSLFLGIHAFFVSVLNKTPRPKFTWEKQYTEDGGILTVHTEVKPLTIGVQHARTAQSTRRDFRLEAVDPQRKSVEPQAVPWVKDDVEMVSEGVYRASFNNPPDGWLAFYIEMTFPGADETSTFEFTTETMIIPDKFPFPDCEGDACKGTLV